jgi:hypothetical protein
VHGVAGLLAVRAAVAGADGSGFCGTSTFLTQEDRPCWAAFAVIGFDCCASD